MRAIVLVLRGGPAGWLGAYGNESVATPHLDQLSAEAIVFDRHISDCPEPVAARRALTGTNLETAPELITALRRAGVRTVLVRANHPDTDAPGWFYDGWDEVFDARPRDEDKSPLDVLLQSFPPLLVRLAGHDEFLLWVEIDRLLPPWDVPQEVFEAYLREEDDEDEDEQPDAEDDSLDDADESPDADEDALDEADEPDTDDGSESRETDEPVTPWADPPTGPFDPPDPDARDWLFFSFAAVVSRLDAELGFLLDSLRERGLDRTAAWLVTSDFGLPLGEHGQIGLYRPWLHEELVHLPLMLRLPGAAEACRRVGGFTQPPDVPATLLDLFGVKGPGSGQSLLPLARGEAESARTFAITTLALGAAAERAIRTAQWAFLKPVKVPEGEVREPQLFVKPDDRWEVNDVFGHNVDRAEELERLVASPD